VRQKCQVINLYNKRVMMKRSKHWRIRLIHNENSKKYGHA